MTDSIRRVSAAGARRFLVRRHLLSPPRSLPAGLDGVRQAFERLGSIQFDPLGVAGRNHDLVLHARVAGYRSAWTDTLLYDTRELYETFNKGLSLLPTRELPWYRISWDRAMTDPRVAAQHERTETMQHVMEQIRAKGPQSSGDFERHRTASAVNWFWGPTNEIRAALEALWEAGVLGLARREGNRRFYDLAERIYPAELMEHRPTQREQRKHKLLSRYRAHGLLGTAGQAELWLGTAPAKADPNAPERSSREELRAELVQEGAIVPVGRRRSWRAIRDPRGPARARRRRACAFPAGRAARDLPRAAGPAGLGP